MTSSLDDLKNKMEQSKKQPKISNIIIWVVASIFVVFLIWTGVWFSSNQNQIKLTVTNGSELIKKLENRAENAENAQIKQNDSIFNITQSLEKTQVAKDSLQRIVAKDKKTIKQLNEKIDSLLRATTNVQQSDIEPVKRH